MKKAILITITTIIVLAVLMIVLIGKHNDPLTSVPKEPSTPTEELEEQVNSIPLDSPPPLFEEGESPPSGVTTLYLFIGKDPDALEKIDRWFNNGDPKGPPPFPNLADTLHSKETDTSTSPTD